MEETRRNLMVGLFVLCGLTTLGVLIVLFGQGPMALVGGRGTPLRIHFRQAAGIRPENVVTIGGLEIGRVQRVDFIDPARFDMGVCVTALIQPPYRVPMGSKAITTEPVWGQGRPPIQIIPGDATLGMLAPNAVIQGEERGAIQSIFPEGFVATFDKTSQHVGEAAAALTPVLKDLHEILVKRDPADIDRLSGPPGNLASAAARFDATLKHVNDVLGDPATHSQLKEAIANIHTISEDGKAVAAELKATSQELRTVVGDTKTLVARTHATVERLDGEVTAVGRDTRAMLERGSRLLDSLFEVSGAINREEGTVGRLVHDAKLYEALVLTAERLSQTVEEFRLLIKDWQKGKIRVGL